MTSVSGDARSALSLLSADAAVAAAEVGPAARNLTPGCSGELERRVIVLHQPELCVIEMLESGLWLSLSAQYAVLRQPTASGALCFASEDIKGRRQTGRGKGRMVSA